MRPWAPLPAPEQRQTKENRDEEGSPDTELLKSDSKEEKYQEILVPSLLSSTQDGQKPLMFYCTPYACQTPRRLTPTELSQSIQAECRTEIQTAAHTLQIKPLSGLSSETT